MRVEIVKILFKQALVIVIFIIFFLSIGEFLRYILVDDTESFTRVMFHELYTSKKNIDIAFVGSSHCINSFVPSIIDNKLNLYTFNIGSSSQCLDGSLILIQELCSFNKPKHIYLELYYDVNRDEYKDRKQMTSTYILSDYIKPSFKKFIYLLNASSKDYYVDSFILARRNWKKILNFDYIFNLIKKKQSVAYKNYKFDKLNESQRKNNIYYVDRGYCTSDKIFLSHWNDRAGVNNFDKQIKMTEKNDWYKSLLQIINYCKKKNIKLTFVIAPIPNWNVAGKKNYQKYYDFINNIAKKYDINFFDFNFCNSKYFNANDLNFFMDEHHLNRQGSEQFSNIFADFVNGKISKKELFYNTLEEKFNSEEPKVFGFSRPRNYDKLKNFEVNIVSNRDKKIEYKIEIKNKKGKNKLIQDYSINNKFKLSSKDHGKLIVSWRIISNKDKINVIIADY